MPTNTANIESLALASAFLSGIALLVMIVMFTVIIRTQRNEQMREMWMSREFSRMHEMLDSIYRQQASAHYQTPATSQSMASYPAQPQQAAVQPQAAPAAIVMPVSPGPSAAPSPQALPSNIPGTYPPGGAAYAPSPYAPPKRVGADQPGREKIQLPSDGRELVRAVNELLAGNQPYNFEELLHGERPRLNLMRMSPRGSPDHWSSVVLLDPGGEAYFALIDRNRAYLFPNCDRFSATHDPKPLFDGARLDAPIRSLIRPAVLARMSDGAWHLTEKGRVQMR
ncbi:MAG: hypothetical protein LBS72_05630 [Oscillospiraceae bacterium]|jgi:hypothetical protein|nr:hypothetical protein [Oscillospiraceae bacterium]